MSSPVALGQGGGGAGNSYCAQGVDEYCSGSLHDAYEDDAYGDVAGLYDTYVEVGDEEGAGTGEQAQNGGEESASDDEKTADRSSYNHFGAEGGAYGELLAGGGDGDGAASGCEPARGQQGGMRRV